MATPSAPLPKPLRIMDDESCPALTPSSSPTASSASSSPFSNASFTDLAAKAGSASITSHNGLPTFTVAELEEVLYLDRLRSTSSLASLGSLPCDVDLQPITSMMQSYLQQQRTAASAGKAAARR